MTDEPMRPDPDRLLEQTAEAHRGKLKIFFGACAGVGKTFAMLTEAQRLRAQGLDILIGVVETHGRKETAALLKGLATQPPRRISHRGRLVTEFDLDAALARLRNEMDDPALHIADARYQCIAAICDTVSNTLTAEPSRFTTAVDKIVLNRFPTSL